jgi:hypothetical protein
MLNVIRRSEFQHKMVRKERLELSHQRYQNLNLARLPIPPLSLKTCFHWVNYIGYQWFNQYFYEQFTSAPGYISRHFPENSSPASRISPAITATAVKAG